MLSFGHQNINRTGSVTSKPLNMLRGTLIVVLFLLNTLPFPFFAGELVIALLPHILLHFSVEKCNSYFGLTFLTIFDLFHCLF